MNVRFLGRDYYKNGLFVEAFLINDDFVEYWCGHDDFGHKSMCFGVPSYHVNVGSEFEWDFSKYIENFVKKYLDN